MDASGQTYTQSTTIRCKAGAFRVAIRPRTLEAEHGQQIEVDVSACTWAGSPLAGATVAVDGVKTVAKTGADGVARLRVRMPKSRSQHRPWATVIAGGQSVRATSDPIRLRPAQAPKAGEADQAPARSPAPQERFQLVSLEAPSCVDAGKPLEVAFTLTGPPKRRATVAVFVENNRPLGRQVFWVRPGKRSLRFSTQRDWAPSVQVVAVLLDGRRLHTLTRSVYLRPAERLLTLAVQTDRADYKPGQRCTAVVTATDYRGRPVARAEVSLGVIDEAVYLVREDPTPDLFDFFYRYRLPYVCRGRYDPFPPPVESAWFWLGPRDAWGHYQPLPVRWGGRRSLLGAYGGCKMAERSRLEFPVRNKFETAAHWVAQLVTDRDGKARTSFAFPDNLTGWRFTARGVTPNTMVGEVRMARKTLLPLSVDLMLPRAFRAGDRIDLPVVLHNDSEAVRRVQGTTRVGRDEPQPWKARSLAPGADERLTIPVTAADTGPIKLFASVADQAARQGDAVEKKLVPLPAGVPFTRTYSGALGPEAVIRPKLEAPLTPEGLRLALRREPGIAGVVSSALDALIQYPYGCVEQTMSRFMPAVVAAGAMRRAGIDNPAAERLPDVLEKGLARLADYQHADGGWGWWQQDATNDFMTAYVLEGLALCRQSGQPVPEGMLRRARTYLAGQVRQRKLHGSRPHGVGEVTLSVYAAHALATLYAQDPKTHQQGIRDLRAVPPPALKKDAPERCLDAILLADTWRLLGGEDRARKGLRRLSGRVSPKPGDRPSIVAAAALLRLGAALEPDNPRWPALALELVAVRRGPAWGDTLTNSAAVRGLAALLRPASDEAAPVTVLVDGRKIGVLDEEHGWRIDARVARAGEITLKPGKRGSGDFYSLRLEGYFTKAPANPPKPAVTLRTRVAALRPERRELPPVDASGRIAIPRGVTLQIEVEAVLTRPVAHARLTIPRPCGVELVRPPRPAQGVVATEQRDEALHFFIERWEKGTHRLSFLARAEVSGTVAAPPPQLAPMYDDPLPTAVFAPRVWIIKP